MQKRPGSGHFGMKTKVGMRTKTKTPKERMHEMKNKTSGHFGKKIKSGHANENQNLLANACIK
jgi:hypothetical protein